MDQPASSVLSQAKGEVVGMLARAWPDAQSDLIRGMTSAHAYFHTPMQVKHLQTHISHVFLTGEYAYKVKKPLKFEFLDFSTLERRRLACEEELRINRRLAPDLYLGVVPITGTMAYPQVEGAGVPIEYAVKMREFRQDDLLDRVLQRGALTSLIVDAVAHQVAEFHRRLSTESPPEGCGTSEKIAAAALQNISSLIEHLRDPQDLERLDRLRAWTAEQSALLGPTFDRRREYGFVRECHGDLHLGNLALFVGSVRIFDGIDFNPDLRWVDVMNEVAFLAMDLAFRRRRDFAYRFLNQYLELTGDYEGVDVLRYYLVYRAMVRAKVEAIRAHQPDVSVRQRDTLMAKSRDHLNWANEVIALWRPTMILLHGFSGSGKTTRSMTLLETIGAIRIRSDVERKRLHGVSRSEHQQQAVARGLYSASITEQTYGRLADLAAKIVAAGFPVIVDATFLDRERRDQFRRLAKKLQIPFVIADFLADINTLRDRVTNRSLRGRDASDAGLAVLEHQLSHHVPFDEDELSEVVPFDTEQMTAKDVMKEAHHLLNATRK